ncbi:MAG: glycoside hydrolase family 15 protein [Deltaproteobacteria bacterium]|nr:glycoside hydrolase family 15 protein [Deltaproteobacteria bacterium]
MVTQELDHVAIGNGRGIALVAPTSDIDWLCLPRFDSPTIFARLLDEERGGTFAFVGVDGQRKQGELGYLRNTNVSRTVFHDGDAAWEVVDFLPRIPKGLGGHAPLEMVRLLRPLKGHPRLRVIFDPRPGYALQPPTLIETANGIDVRWTGPSFHLTTNCPVTYVLGGRDVTLTRPMWFCLSYGLPSTLDTLAAVEESLSLTIQGWRAWAKTCALPGFHDDDVLRSALCLKLHQYVDTGAIIAASTTSIPEAMGTPRTWDYRYCWLRDSAFVVEALRRLGHLNEGELFLNYLRTVVESGPIQPLYGIDGARELEELTLEHLKGWNGNGPVRVGNAAFFQKQNDLMGEVILCLDTLLRDPRLLLDVESYWPLVVRLVEESIVAAPTLDTGIWEFRSLLKSYTFSRAMCWAAINRGASLARMLGKDDLARRWGGIAETERAEVLTRGFSKELGFFTQALDGRFPDASNLLLPIIGIVDARDPRFLSTLEAYRDLLVKDGLMLRYRNEDDFGETTSAFTICSFWWAEALALAGKLDEAVEVFENVLRHQNDNGLFSEDVEPLTGRLLGNFPQAYTHVGLIHAASTIGEHLRARGGGLRTWR